MTTTMMDFLNTTGYPVYQDNRMVIRDTLERLYTAIAWILIPVNLLGLITNSLNVITYARNGVGDAVTICFFALSLCDLCYIIMSSAGNIIHIIGVVRPFWLSKTTVDLTKFGFYESMVFEMSALVKTFIAVQRGCCIAFPFHVSRVFTNKRTTAVMVCLCLFSLTSYVNREFLDSKNYVQIRVTNNTYVSHSNNNTYVNHSYNNVVVDLSDLVRDILKTVVVFASEILVLLSLIVIVHGMASSLKYHQTLYGKEDDNQQKRVRNNKEMRVVKQVILVSVMHLICYTPVVTHSFMNQLLLKGYIPFIFWYIPLELDQLKRLAGPLNAAINFFIYYTYNSKFRRRVINICNREQQAATRSSLMSEQLTVDQTY